ncbi:MAG TPA: HAD family hydrolase [Bacteroidales bacterium]|nr:MAG: HAD family hydrolase [Bacteroidetes bacterium GWF2_33_38]OFY71506.1 MAG: HAD family hydrolase [Bacteroidetes bacterium RIFOXYA12_FULL_33_9]OFY90868.1 MAG: HAD family hydrolase [Bacteroidetes bacterium RIFOXYA2_FULL_33_7]HBF87828.1 HAD family hydrolase [Bacteroidales bacterium]
MNIKLIVADMDGTLLNSKSEINPEFYPTFERLKEKNILFAVASGRQYFNLLARFDELKNDIVFMAENGSYVLYQNKQILLSSLDRQTSIKMIEKSRTLTHAYRILCGAKFAYIEQNSPEFITQVEKYYARYKIVDDLSQVDDDILKVTICDLTGTKDNNASAFAEFENDLLVAISGKFWLDISVKNANKGYAVKKTQEIFNISPEETMVFGDYLNDIQLMDSAFYSFAMENAHPEIKKIARFVAKSNDENGVVESIKKFVLS